jgi:hypothetical protein
MRRGGMIGENGQSRDENHDHDTKRKMSRLDSNALIQGLERLRESVEQKLYRLETLARERAAEAVPDAPELDLRLKQRIADFEEAQLRLRAQTERREQEWRTALEQIESDRKLLAEAWEQLENERLEETASTRTQQAGRPPLASRGNAPPLRPHPEVVDPSNDQVAHAILKQFHALRNDVRRNARQRGARRTPE